MGQWEGLRFGVGNGRVRCKIMPSHRQAGDGLRKS